MVKQPTVISLFSGCGGSSLGYKWAGFRELLAIDFDQNSVDTFRLNFPEIPCWHRDIREVTGQEIMEFCHIKKGQLDLLDASPPCQGFSTAGKRKVSDPRNDLFRIGARIESGLEPSFPRPGTAIITTRQAIGDLPVGVPGKHQPQVIEAWHRSMPGQSLRKASRYVGSFQSCRLDPNNVSPTLIKAHRHWHYAVPRQLNDLELKRICSFPDNFKFPGKQDGKSGNKVGQRLGNAVMPKFMQAVASHVKDTLLDA